MDLKSSDEKEKILHDQYDINLAGDMRKELTNMGGLMEPLFKVAAMQAAAETEKKSKLEDIRSIMKKLNMTAQQAMDILDVPTDKQNEYASLV